MLKIIGILLIFFSCIYFAFLKIYSQKSALTSLRFLIDDLNTMADEISVFSRPIAEISEKLGKRDGDVFFNNLSKELKKENTSLQKAWENSLFSLDGIFPKGSILPLKTLGSSLGSLSVELENENIKRASKSLEAIYETENEAFKTSSKTTKSVSFLSAIVIIILFI